MANRKTKKHLDVARKKLQHLQQQLAGAKKQMDDPEEVVRLQREVAAVEKQIEALQHE